MEVDGDGDGDDDDDAIVVNDGSEGGGGKEDASGRSISVTFCEPAFSAPGSPAGWVEASAAASVLFPVVLFSLICFLLFTL